MAEDKTNRDMVRSLVRDAVHNALASVSETSAAPATHSPTVAAEAEAMPDESAKTILTEADVRGLHANSKLRVAANVKLTPLAADIIKERHIELVTRVSRKTQLPPRIIAVGADHGGFDYKQQLIVYLESLNQRPRDFGTHSTDAVDYPDIAAAVARAVANRECELGIMIDGAGIGSAMTANKIRGIRAAACYSTALAKNSREHNGANVLTLGSSINSFAEVKEIVATWLNSELTEDRHRKRVAKIEATEHQFSAANV